MNGGVVGDRGAAQICSVIALAVLNGIGVVGAGWIGVGNGDGLIVSNGVGERELNGVAGDGNAGDGIGSASGCDCEVRSGSCCGREGLVEGEDDLGACLLYTSDAADE